MQTLTDTEKLLIIEDEVFCIKNIQSILEDLTFLDETGNETKNIYKYRYLLERQDKHINEILKLF